MKSGSKVLVTGAKGLVGSAVVERLTQTNQFEVVAAGRDACDLLDRTATDRYFDEIRPDYVFHFAALVYGIMGNMRNKGLSFLNNVLINTHVIEAARRVGVRKVVAMGSGCVYPYPAPSLPLKECDLWQGMPHESEDSYAHAKRAMLAQLQAYRESDGLDSAFVISCNLFGPRDKFDVALGHVVPSLVKKFCDAKKNNGRVLIWGNGSARRDFMYVKDAAKACCIIMDKISGPVNMGSGRVSSIREIVDTLAAETGMQDRLSWDESKPNGQDFRQYDLQRLCLAGFKPDYTIEDGLRETYRWYEEHSDKARS